MALDNTARLEVAELSQVVCRRPAPYLDVGRRGVDRADGGVRLVLEVPISGLAAPRWASGQVHCSPVRHANV